MNKIYIQSCSILSYTTLNIITLKYSFPDQYNHNYSTPNLKIGSR